MTTIAKITNPQRRQDWLTVFATDEVQLKSPIPHRAGLPGLDGAQLVYEADLTALTADQRQRLITHIAARFQLPAEVIARDLDAVGLPILADDVMITSDNIGVLLSAIGLDAVSLPILADDVMITSDNIGVLLSAIDDGEPTPEDWRALAADLEDEEE